jgi:hypothetical protein
LLPCFLLSNTGLSNIEGPSECGDASESGNGRQCRILFSEGDRLLRRPQSMFEGGQRLKQRPLPAPPST